MRCSLQDIFATHFDAYAQQHTLHPRELRAAWCIRHCYTPAMGSHALVCPQGHYLHIQHHACRHRSCPRCADRPRALWTASQLQRLLPCPHVHVVFTLPHVLLPLWAFNRAAMAALLFECVRDSLLALMADPKRLGVVPALVMALHTWGRNLSHHPHVHCVLSAGGVDASGHWKDGCSAFLLPLKPLQCLFRGKFLARLKALLSGAKLGLPPAQPLPHWLACIKQLYTAHWNIEIQPPYDHARGLALYLARYVKGGPLPSERALSLDARGFVRLPYTDHRDGRAKTLCLSAHDFISRILWHAPPSGVHTVRYAGLYSPHQREQYLLARRHLSPQPMPALAPRLAAHELIASSNPPTPEPKTCPDCHAPLVRQLLPRSVHQSSEFSRATPAPSPHHHHTPRPNPSFKLTGNGVARQPASAGPAAHFALAVQRTTPLPAA